MKFKKIFLLLAIINVMSLTACDSTPEAEISNETSAVVEPEANNQVTTTNTVGPQMTESTNISDSMSSRSIAPPQNYSDPSVTEYNDQGSSHEATVEEMEAHGEEFYADTIKRLETENGSQSNQMSQ